MVEAKIRHNRISGNPMVCLANKWSSSNCEAFNSMSRLFVIPTMGFRLDRRTEKGFVSQQFDELTNIVPLPTLGLELALSELYRGIGFLVLSKMKATGNGSFRCNTVQRA